MNGRQIVGQIQAQMFTNNGDPCPNCGQQNVKVRNALNLVHITSALILTLLQKKRFGRDIEGEKLLRYPTSDPHENLDGHIRGVQPLTMVLG